MRDMLGRSRVAGPLRCFGFLDLMAFFALFVFVTFFVLVALFVPPGLFDLEAFFVFVVFVGGMASTRTVPRAVVHAILRPIRRSTPWRRRLIIEVQGRRADERGDDDCNLRLTAERAAAVKAYLVDKSIDAEQAALARIRGDQAVCWIVERIRSSWRWR
jgi:hypothetical protein